MVIVHGAGGGTHVLEAVRVGEKDIRFHVKHAYSSYLTPSQHGSDFYSLWINRVGVNIPSSANPNPLTLTLALEP